MLLYDSQQARARALLLQGLQSRWCAAVRAESISDNTTRCSFPGLAPGTVISAAMGPG